MSEVGVRIEWRKGDTVTVLLCNVANLALATQLANRLLEEAPRLKGYRVSEVRQLGMPLAAGAHKTWHTFDDPPEGKRRKKHAET